jgi:hypothetical protein
MNPFCNESTVISTVFILLRSGVYRFGGQLAVFGNALLVDQPYPKAKLRLHTRSAGPRDGKLLYQGSPLKQESPVPELGPK